MVRGIYAAFVIIVALFVAAIVVVLNSSVEQANQYGMLTERKLVQREFQRQIDEVVRFQAEVSFSDRTAAELSEGDISRNLIDARLKGSLWEHYGFSWIIVTDQQHGTRLALMDGEKVSNGDADGVLFWIDDLIDEAVHAYEASLQPVDGGFRLSMPAPDRALLSPRLPMIHAADMRMVDGRMCIVVVQAVVPKNLQIPATGRAPKLMVTVKPVTPQMMVQMDERLAIGGLDVVKGQLLPSGQAYSPIGKGFTDGPFVVSWQPNAPGAFIVAALWPRLLAMALAAAISIGFIAWRFGTLVKVLQRSEAENRFLAKHDGLTGLANRAHFDEELARLVRTGAPFSLVALDLDRFKAVNDQFGHAAGDAVLVALSARFRDRIGAGGFVARLGGDEFMAVIRGNNAEAVVSLANGLVIDAQVPVPHNGTLLGVGASAGIARFPEHGAGHRAILHSADLALYAAKNRGRNCAMTFDAETMEPASAAA